MYMIYEYHCKSIYINQKEQEKEKVGKVIDETTDFKCCVPAKELCGFFRACGFISKAGRRLENVLF